MNVVIVAASGVALLLTLSGCSSADPPDPGASHGDTSISSEPSSVVAELRGGEPGGSVERLKARIRAIAYANTTRTDNFEEVARQLRPLVRALVAVAPPKTDEEKLRLLEGTWKNAWSNLAFGEGRTDLTKIFQTVTLEGHYYNFSEVTGLPFPAVNALRGAYAPIPGGFAIRFTRTGFFQGTLVGRDLDQLARDVESGAQPLLTFGPTEAPAGPVGISGRLLTPYVDEDFRVGTGDQTPFFDDQGQVLVPGQDDLIFILDRQLGPASP